MKITVEGKTYEHDPNRLLNSEAITVKRLTSMTIPEWQTGLDGDDPEAVKALVFLLKRRAGEDPDWNTLDFDHAQLTFDGDDRPDGDEQAPKGEGAPGS